MPNPGFSPAPLLGAPPSDLKDAASAAWVRKVVDVGNRTLQGKLNATTQITLRANQTTTTITDARIGPYSVILLSPVTADAAVLDSLGWWVSAQTDGACTITHASQPTSDQTFNCFIAG